MANVRLLWAKANEGAIATLQAAIEEIIGGLAAGTPVEVGIEAVSDNEVLATITYGDGVAGLNTAGIIDTVDVDDADYQVLTDKPGVNVINLTAARAITLPDVADVEEGHVCYVFNGDGSATGANTITVSGDVNIDGAASVVLNAAYAKTGVIMLSGEWSTLP